jgi:hypothetical protein
VEGLPKSASRDVVCALVEVKQRNPTRRCPRIAGADHLAFGVPINKDNVPGFSQIVIDRHRTAVIFPGSHFLEHMKDSRWRIHQSGENQ